MADVPGRDGGEAFGKVNARGARRGMGKGRLDEWRVGRVTPRLPGRLSRLTGDEVGFLLAAYPGGLPTDRDGAMGCFSMPRGDAAALERTARGLREKVCQILSEAEVEAMREARGGETLTEGEEAMVARHGIDGDGLWSLREALAREAFPGLAGLTGGEMALVAAKLRGGWDEGTPPDLLLADARRIGFLHDKLAMSMVGGVARERMEEEIVRLGGDADPDSDMMFGIKAAAGVAAIGLAMANPDLARGGPSGSRRGGKDGAA